MGIRIIPHYANATTCPRCGAEPDILCKSGSGRDSYEPHAARVEKAYAERAWEKK